MASSSNCDVEFAFELIAILMYIVSKAVILYFALLLSSCN